MHTKLALLFAPRAHALTIEMAPSAPPHPPTHGEHDCTSSASWWHPGVWAKEHRGQAVHHHKAYVPTPRDRPRAFAFPPRPNMDGSVSKERGRKGRARNG